MPRAPHHQPQHVTGCHIPFCFLPPWPLDGRALPRVARLPTCVRMCTVHTGVLSPSGQSPIGASPLGSPPGDDDGPVAQRALCKPAPLPPPLVTRPCAIVPAGRALAPTVPGQAPSPPPHRHWRRGDESTRRGSQRSVALPRAVAASSSPGRAPTVRGLTRRRGHAGGGRLVPSPHRHGCVAWHGEVCRRRRRRRRRGGGGCVAALGGHSGSSRGRLCGNPARLARDGAFLFTSASARPLTSVVLCSSLPLHSGRVPLRPVAVGGAFGGPPPLPPPSP